MDENLYDHEDDSFEQFMEGNLTPIISVNLPVGETLVVNGPRLTPVVVTITNKAERHPKRDARMLSTFLSCSLDEQTVFHLAEYLFAEHLAPMMNGSGLMAPLKPVNDKAERPKKKSPPKQVPPDGPQDEHPN